MSRPSTILLFLLAAAPATAPGDVVEDLVRPSRVRYIDISPDGRRVAYALAPETGRTDSIVVLELDNPDPVAASRTIDVSSPVTETRVTTLQWVSNTRLFAALDYEFKVQPKNTPKDGPPYRTDWLYSYDVTGARPPVSLGSGFRPNAAIGRAIGGGQDVVMMSKGMTARDLYRVNIETGAMTLLEKADPTTYSWRVKDGKALLKINSVSGGEDTVIFERDADDDRRWKKLTMYSFPADRWFARETLGTASGVTEVYQRRTRAGTDTDGIHVHDYASKSVTATLLELPGIDLASALIRRDSLIAANYFDGIHRQLFVKPEWQQQYELLRGRLTPHESANVVEMNDAGDRWLVHVSGPQSPGEYFVYSTAGGALRPIVVTRPWLDRTQFAAAESWRVKARDGTEIRATLTCPQDGRHEPRPLIVVPPPDPTTYRWLRFDATAQAFASEGWCVVEPDTRGTYGRGRSFQRAGHGEWGGGIAQDLVDVVNAAIESGIADRDRIALLAEGLGAYAALIAGFENPWAGAVLYSPIVDLKRMLDQRESRFGKASIVVEEWKDWLGKLEGKSPVLFRAGELKYPLLVLQHTGWDWWVPKEQAQMLESALKDAGRPATFHWVENDLTWDAAARQDSFALHEAIAFLRPLLNH